MNRTALSIIALTALLFPASSPAAPKGHGHEGVSAEKLGTIHFPISIDPKSQQDFERAVALLHSFEYESAERGFRAIADRDPNCGMAYWGIAMCNYMPGGPIRTPRLPIKPEQTTGS